MNNLTASSQNESVNTQLKKPHSTQAKGSVTVNNSWSTTISHYLLQRRVQTQSAYQAQLETDSVPEHERTDEQDDSAKNWLFKALFEVLIQRLEEGHTVLILDSDNNDSSDITDNTIGLYPWQQQLLHPLLQSISPHAEDISAGIALLTNSSLWEASLLQSPLSQYEQQILQERYATCVKLYHDLKESNQHNSNQNSLSKFICKIRRNRLTKDEKESASPIIFQVKNNLVNQELKITLWLQRTWQAEYTLARNIIRIKSQNLEKLSIILDKALSEEQKAAIHIANNCAFSIITGGPGTGKTFTIAQLVIALQQAQTKSKVENLSEHANLALAAPTGKAAQRMQESLQNALQYAGVNMQLPEAKTIHRLLGIGQGGQPRYHKDNPLSEDIIIIDEASMLGVELANHLVSAVKSGARLILLGDANQLAAVDAGSVLADLCRIPALRDNHKRLENSQRFTAESGIGQLARLINQDDTDMFAVWQLIQTNEMVNFYQLETNISRTDSSNISHESIQNSLNNYQFISRFSHHYGHYIKETAQVLTQVNTVKSISNTQYRTYFDKLMQALNQFKILTAGHHGRCGDHSVNRYISEQHKKRLKLPLSKSTWYHGRPVMILQNNYELGLFNGDVGICMQISQGRLQVFFENKKQGIAVNMLNDEMVATAYAMTIHKSQGSEFEHVAICFDDNNTRLLSQELIYTAVTRAKKQVSIFGTVSALTRALSTATERQTGLGLQFETCAE